MNDNRRNRLHIFAVANLVSLGGFILVALTTMTPDLAWQLMLLSCLAAAVVTSVVMVHMTDIRIWNRNKITQQDSAPDSSRRADSGPEPQDK